MRLIKPSSKLRRVVACFYRALSKPKILQRVRKHLITFRFRKTLIFNYSVVWYATINFLSLEADHLYIFTLAFQEAIFFFHLTETLRSPWVEAVFLCGKFCYISPVCLSFNSKIKPLSVILCSFRSVGWRRQLFCMQNAFLKAFRARRKVSFSTIKNVTHEYYSILPRSWHGEKHLSLQSKTCNTWTLWRGAYVPCI